MSSDNAQSAGRPRVSVVLPTYKRPEVLVGCLRALHHQSEEPLEVLVCYRSDDTDTSSAIQSLDDVDRRLIHEVLLNPGENLAAGLRAGIEASAGELIALTDDDAEAPPEWISRLIDRFGDPSIAGVGGRDLIAESEGVRSKVVGKVQWFGRRIANHQTGFGEPRDVDVLKGVNCCFRGERLREVGIDQRLRGGGNVAHWELAICLPLIRSGWRLVYDPSVTLTHHICERKDGDVNQRGGFQPEALRDIVHNETLMLLEHLGVGGRLAFAVWGTLVGTHFTPGLLAAARSAIKKRAPRTAAHRFLVTIEGRIQGLKSWLSTTSDRRHAKPRRQLGSGVA